ncbi:hypothetical protein RBG61_11920 [Paludicola sp. MB14-C6]|uniref:hypothetical protein n=1 Tax=Paludihabitans sp. MB14-C6 TaxID=3070656 RepID=UPI0027DC245F|nr:hypothetical protein [Paludicola sp. MB14-C6]WMJ22690.1 hypothetical protein RBG61_11920 [Paludicola sp. MB14-C6]
MDEQKEYIIPPRLNKKYLIYGFTFFELIFSVCSAIMAILLHLLWLLPISAIVTAVCWRTPTNQKNAIDTIILLHKYYGKPQHFSLRECEKENESN